MKLSYQYYLLNFFHFISSCIILLLNLSKKCSREQLILIKLLLIQVKVMCYIAFCLVCFDLIWLDAAIYLVKIGWKPLARSVVGKRKSQKEAQNL